MTDKERKDMLATALWGGGVSAAATKFGLTENEVMEELIEFGQEFQNECEARSIGEYEFDKREALKEEMLGIEDCEED